MLLGNWLASDCFVGVRRRQTIGLRGGTRQNFKPRIELDHRRGKLLEDAQVSFRRALAIDERNPEQPRTYGQVPPPAGPAFVEDLPEIESSARLFMPSGQIVFTINGRNFQEREWFIADPELFEIMDYEFLSGDPSTALNEPNSIVLTESDGVRFVQRGGVRFVQRGGWVV